MRWPEAAITEALRSACGANTRLEAITPLSGGDINHAARLDTSSGALFIKGNEQVLSGLFSAEAAGLRALAASGTRLVVPNVVAHRDPAPGAPGFLITELLDASGPEVPGFDDELGAGLAELHRATRDTFGFDGDNYIGTTTQPNPATSRWVDFYRDQRLRHQVRTARNNGQLSARDVATCERLGERLDALLTESAPALIHGDLWSGNLFRHRGRPALIDPAAYYGHPEAELGMMTLFGGFSRRTYEVYAEHAGLEADWRDRNPLYQLYHLLNHANLFGGGYAASSLAIVRRYAS